MQRRGGFPYDRLVLPQLAAGERSVSTQQAVDLVALAELARQEPASTAYFRGSDDGFAISAPAWPAPHFSRGSRRFLEQYGHRGHYESDWSLPRLHENPRRRCSRSARIARGPAAGSRRAVAAPGSRGPARDGATSPRPDDVAAVDDAAARPRRRCAPSSGNTCGAKQSVPISRASSRGCAPGISSLADRFVERGWIDRRDDYFLLAARRGEARRARFRTGSGLRAIAARRAAQLAAERDLSCRC